MNNLKREYSWMGYVRKDGAMGIRSKVPIIYTVECVSFVARGIVRLAGDPETEVVGFLGCTDSEYAVRLLVALIRHPNVGTVLTVGLRYEYVQPEWLTDIAGEGGGEAAWMFIQRKGGVRKTIEKSLAVVGLMRERPKGAKRKPMGIRGLIIGAGCGGSDYTNGLAGDVVVGRFFDQLTDLGGTAIFEGIVEAIGLKEMLAGRTANKRARQEIGDTYDKALEYCKPVRQHSVSPGNFMGRLSIIEEKSMRTLIKSGSRPIEGILKVGIEPPHPGLWLLDSAPDPYWMQFGITSLSNNEELMDLAAYHGHIAFLVAGGGNVVGSAVAPCTKITGNPVTYRAMGEGMDFDAGPVLEGRCPQDEMVQRLLKMTAEMASGTKSKSEALGHKEYFIPYKCQDRNTTKRCREA